MLTKSQKESQKKYMQKLRSVTIRVNEEYYDKLKEAADKEGISIWALVKKALNNEIGAEDEKPYYEATATQKLALGGAFKRGRKENYYNITQAAKEIGISAGTLCRYENGKSRLKKETVDRIAEYYGIDIKDYLEATYINDRL